MVEMIVAIIVNPSAGDAYLGTQGDIWDSQKDMAMAATGAFISMVATATIRTLRKPRAMPLSASAPSGTL